jgi:hypothetical protein
MLEHYSHVRQEAKRDAVNVLSAKRPSKPTIEGCDTNNDTKQGERGRVEPYVIENMVGTRRLELLTFTVSKSAYQAIQQLTGYPGLPKSVIIRHSRDRKRNECGTDNKCWSHRNFRRLPWSMFPS